MGHGLIKRELIQAETEITYGVDPTPAATDSILVRNVSHAPDRLRMVRRGAIRTSLGELQHIYAGMLEAISFECEVKGSGVLGTPPEISPLFRACGLLETINAGVSVVYTPRSSGIESCAIHYFKAAAGGATQVRHILLGCRGNLELVYTAGDILLARFSMIGRRSNPTDQTLPSPTYDTTVPVGIRGMSTTIGGVAGLVIQNYTINSNNEVVVPDNLNDAEGFGEITIGGRDPTLELNRHHELVVTIAPWADMVAGTNRAFASGNLGPATNRVTLAAAQMHYRGIANGEDSGMRTEADTFGLHEAAVDSDFSLTFA